MPEGMGPVTITVHGNSAIFKPAERAVMHIHVSSQGLSQTSVSHNVTRTSNQIKEALQSLSPKTETGEATPDAPVTHWSMSSLSTGSWQVYDGKGSPPKRNFNAFTSFEVKFRDFTQLGAAAQEFSLEPCVSIRNIEWRLTERTLAQLGSQSRMAAVKDAVDKARDYAKACGLTNLQPVEISDVGASPGLFGMTGQQQSQMRLGNAQGSGKSEGVLSFAPEDVSIRSSVTVKCHAR